jgi:hypothetical protein
MAGPINEVVDNYLNVHLKAQPRFELKEPVRKEQLPGFARSIAIFDRHGAPATSIGFGEDWKLEIEYTLNQPVNNFIVAAGIKNNMEVPVRTAWSKSQKLEPGNYVASFEFGDVMIETGIYNIEIGLSDKESTFSSSDGQAFFTVEASGGVNSEILRLSGAGIVLNPAKVEIKKMKG